MNMHNIWDDPVAAAQVRSVAGGNETVPTVRVGDRFLVNPRAGAVVALLSEHGSDTDVSRRRRGTRQKATDPTAGG